MAYIAKRKTVTIVAALLVSAMFAGKAAADAVADFYKGKTVTVVVAAGPGGGHTKYTQFIAPFLKKHMPGNPKFIVQNMGGAGGTKAANFLYTRGLKNGTMIGILLSDTPLASRLRTTGVKYVANEFQFLGGADQPRSAFVVFKNAGVKTLDDAKAAWAHVAEASAKTPGMHRFQSSWNEESKTAYVTEIFDNAECYLSLIHI